MTVTILVSSVCLAISACGSGKGSKDGDTASPNATRRVWVAPNTPDDFPQLFEPGAPWPSVKAGARVFKLYSGTVSARNIDLEAVVSTLDEAGLATAIEAGGLRGWECSGARMAELDIDILAAIAGAGGRVDYIVLDAPFAYTLETGGPEGCGYTVEQTASELVEYCETLKDAYPHTSIGWIEPVPWYTVGAFPNNPGSRLGDLPSILDATMAAMQQGGQSLDFFHADSPYDYNEALPGGQGWEKLKALEDAVEGHGLRFGLIYNSERGGNSSDELFHDDTIDALQKFAAAGGDPADLIVQSWYSHPEAVLPEDLPFTFTHLAKDFLGRLP